MSTLTVGSLFTGVDGLGLALDNIFPNLEHIWVSEIEPAAVRALESLYGAHPLTPIENTPAPHDKNNPPSLPNLGDITKIKWGKVERPNILTGGFPCQDLSLAGRRKGLAGAKSGLWKSMLKGIRKLRPDLVVIENVMGLRSGKAISDVEPCPTCVDGIDPEHRMRALGVVLSDLACIGYDAQWTSVRASDVGAPHQRMRVFILAWPRAENADRTTGNQRRESTPGKKKSWRAWADFGRRGGAFVPDANGERLEEHGARRGHDKKEIARNERNSTFAADPGRLDGNSGGAKRGKFKGGGALGSVERYSAADRKPHSDHTDWGDYGPAIQRWEDVRQEAAPVPTMIGARGGKVLCPKFVEWMVGVPVGHVTGHGLTRNQQLRILGNIVVPQQAEYAIRQMLISASRTDNISSAS